MGILVDSSVWIDNLRSSDTPQVRKLRTIERPQSIIVGDLVLVEVLRGARDDRHAKRLEAEMRQFDTVSLCSVELAPLVAANDRLLRSKGVTVRKLVDLVVATYCIEHDHRLLHSDRDFTAMRPHLDLQFY